MHYTIKEKIEYYTVCFLIFLTSVLPKNFIYGFFSFLSSLFFKFLKIRSSLTIKNLKLAYPEKNDKEIKQMALETYKNISITIAEIIMLLNDRLDINKLITNKKDALKKIEQITKNAKNGVIVITAHFSNWELAAQFLSLNGYPMLAVGRQGNNKLIEKNITTPFRQKYGNTNIYKRNAVLKIVKTLKKNKNVGLLIDQKAGHDERIQVNFFGKPADTINSIATLKLKFNPIILPIFIPRQKDGTYKIIVCDPVDYIASEENDKQNKIKKITQKYNDILEEIINEYPTQWFWMHNRWRFK